MDLPLAVRLPVFLNSLFGNTSKSPIDADRSLAIVHYKKTTQEISERLAHEGKTATFQQAAGEDTAWLDEMKFPYGVKGFFTYFEPQKTIQLERVLLVPIIELKETTIKTPMGQVITPYGYRIVAKTKGLDVYCIDINHVDMTGQSPVYLITGNALMGDRSVESVREACYLIATSFTSFLDGL